MNMLTLPWLEWAILLPFVGSLYTASIREAEHARRWGIGVSVVAFACTFLAWWGFYRGIPVDSTWSLQPTIGERTVFAVDELSAPLVPVVALVHLLTCIATTRNKAQRFSFGLALTSEAIRIALFCCVEPWVLIALLVSKTIPAGVDLYRRGRPIRLYVLHMCLFAGLLVGGWYWVEQADSVAEISSVAILLVFAAILIRCGTVPFHSWVTDLFQHGSLGNTILVVTPLTGVYAALRLVLPIAPDWVLHSLGVISLLTAVYSAGMATIQRDARRFFAFLLTSHASLVLLGLELATHVSLTGSLALWFSIIISLGGFGLSLRALEARFGRLQLTTYRGLYDQAPVLAVCFLLTGLASVGFPGTVGFVSTELLVDGAVHANLPLGLGVVLAAALNGIAVVRAYFLIFTGQRHTSSISLTITPRERMALLLLAAMILGGGLYPQPGLETRHRAAIAIGKIRHERHITNEPETPDEEEPS